MDDQDAIGNSDTGLTHLHVCIHCGHPRKREEITDREISSGVVHCPKCGLDGPLNIEIQNPPGNEAR